MKFVEDIELKILDRSNRKRLRQEIEIMQDHGHRENINDTGNSSTFTCVEYFGQIFEVSRLGFVQNAKALWMTIKSRWIRANSRMKDTFIIIVILFNLFPGCGIPFLVT